MAVNIHSKTLVDNWVEEVNHANTIDYVILDYIYRDNVWILM